MNVVTPIDERIWAKRTCSVTEGMNLDLDRAKTVFQQSSSFIMVLDAAKMPRANQHNASIDPRTVTAPISTPMVRLTMNAELPRRITMLSPWQPDIGYR
jgi:hypothetical protein